MPDSLVSADWELIDPTPDPLALFAQYNKTFFWGKLDSVVVTWSPRMTSCAGICCYEGRGGLCSIKLSTPLLKLRPRKDLVETLLHEMIHAYLFVTQNNRDRDGHGPEFQKHMHRINALAKTNITIYHTFYDEVSHYKTHVWRCDGPCRHRKPYHGFLRRASNRAPGPNDFWWKDHQSSCGGTYHKISEPQEFTLNQEKKKAKERAKELKEENRKKSLITNYLTKTDSSEAQGEDNSSKSSSSSSKPRFTGMNVLGRGTTLTTSSSQSSSVRKIKGVGEIPLRVGAHHASTSTLPSGSKRPTSTMNESHKHSPKVGQSPCSKTSQPAMNSGPQAKESGSMVRKRPRSAGHAVDTLANFSQRSRTDVVVLSDSDDDIPLLYRPAREPFVERADNSTIQSGTSASDLTLAQPVKIHKSSDVSGPPCPLCGVVLPADVLPHHVDECLKGSDAVVEVAVSRTAVNGALMTICPVCTQRVPQQKINEHLDSLCVSYVGSGTAIELS